MRVEGDLVDEQVRFYRADAHDYDAWLTSLLDDANRAPEAAAFRAGRRRAAAMLEARGPLGRVLEIAAGTGILTELLAPHATALTLLDASPESLDLARARLAAMDGEVELVCADVFGWHPPEGGYDTICFSSWLHHVPRDRFDGFWATVAEALAPGGEVIFDFGQPSGVRRRSIAEAPDEPSEGYALFKSGDVSVRDHRRRRWHVVDVMWEADDLADRLDALGWDLTILTEGWFEGFWWASARRSTSGEGLE